MHKTFLVAREMVRPLLAVRLSGTVVPGNATVTLDGKGVPVKGGKWRKTLRDLDRGETDLTVAATAPGREEYDT